MEFWKLINLGTAGVWRISALNEAGGWKDRTTVEDMDLAVRASLKGWKFVYVGDLKVMLLIIRDMPGFLIRFSRSDMSFNKLNLTPIFLLNES